jgi:hypothetical protein
MAQLEHAVMAWWLLMFLCFVFVMAGLMAYLVFRFRSLRAFEPTMADTGESRGPVEPVLREPEPLHFGARRANAWLAVRGVSVKAVQSALALQDAKPCSWAEGLAEGHEQSLFVAPPVRGWILVIGPALPDPADDVDMCFRFLSDLSRKLGQIQFFQVNGVVNHHAWVRAETGRIVRAYAWAGKTLWNQGPLTPAENALEMRCYDYGESPDAPLIEAGEPRRNNGDKVHLLAARWSLDPDEVGLNGVGQERGIIGETSGLF